MEIGGGYLMWLCLRADGHKSVAIEAVNVRFPSGTPVDGQSVTAVASAKVAAKLTSRRTVMNDLGIEDPDSELKRIIVEEKMLQLVPKVLLTYTTDQHALVPIVGIAHGVLNQTPPFGLQLVRHHH